jgi:hypothetical protein
MLVIAAKDANQLLSVLVQANGIKAVVQWLLVNMQVVVAAVAVITAKDIMPQQLDRVQVITINAM